MSRKRSKYRPKPVMVDPLVMFKGPDEAGIRRVMLSYLTALQDVANGQHPGANEWRHLADLVNVTSTFVRVGKLIESEVGPDIAAATTAMKDAAERYERGLGMRLSAAGLNALRSLMRAHELCLRHYTAKEVEMVVAETRRIVAELQRSRNATVTQL